MKLLHANALCLGLLPMIAIAQPGTPDQSFGSFSLTVTDLSAYEDAWRMAIQPDDRIVVVGMSEIGSAQGLILRYEPNGPLDQNFGTGGYVALEEMTAEDVALESGGNILVCGAGSPPGFRVMRFLPNGTVDEAFGDQGITLMPFPSGNSVAVCITVHPDGRIITGGWATTSNGADLALFRCMPDGLPDPSFGDNGRVTATIDDYTFVHDVLVQPDGRIVACGYTSASNNVTDIVLARFLENGDPDASFGINGVARFNATNANEEAYTMALQTDGRLVVVGVTDVEQDYLVIRAMPDGTLDPSFDGDGIAITDIDNDSEDAPFGVAIQPDERILVSGYSNFQGTGSAFSIARYMPDGTLDAGFSGDGRNTILSGLLNWGGSGLGLQSNGRIIAVGGRVIGVQQDQDILIYGIRSGLTIGIDEQLTSSLAASIRPNPVEDQCMVDLALQRNERVTLRIVDVTGREQMPVIDLGLLPVGEQRFSLDLRSLASGAYILLVGQGPSVTSLQLLKR
jgi:uncharacterized delta-60 repeat protein